MGINEQNNKTSKTNVDHSAFPLFLGWV